MLFDFFFFFLEKTRKYKIFLIISYNHLMNIQLRRSCGFARAFFIKWTLKSMVKRLKFWRKQKTGVSTGKENFQIVYETNPL